MIVEGYSLHLYCEGCVYSWGAWKETLDVGRDNKKQAWREAKNLFGWRKIMGHVFCSVCVEKGIKKPNQYSQYYAGKE